MGPKDLFYTLCIALVVGFLFVGWIALLQFPWVYSVKAALIFEAVLIIFLIMAENDAARVDGAGGWTFFAFMLGHVILFSSAGFFRILVLLWSLF